MAFARDALGAKVRLADDSRMTIRPIESADAPLLAAAFDELSEEPRYRRFFMASPSAAPHARLHVVKGGGHLFLLDEPHNAAPPIRAFLDED